MRPHTADRLEALSHGSTIPRELTLTLLGGVPNIPAPCQENRFEDLRGLLWFY